MSLATFLSVAEEPGETEVIDGWVVDGSGEVIGHVGAYDCWRADSAEAVEWALERRAEVEADILALRARRAAIKANLDAREKSLAGRLAWWDFRFRGEVVAIARRSLAGLKGRTARFAHGTVAFRATQGKTEITDMDAAVAFVERYAPGAVKVTRTVGVKAIDEAVAAFVAANGCEPSLGFAMRSGPGETITVETGVTPESSNRTEKP